jgi:hypothetical protein
VGPISSLKEREREENEDQGTKIIARVGVIFRSPIQKMGISSKIFPSTGKQYWMI